METVAAFRQRALARLEEIDAGIARLRKNAEQAEVDTDAGILADTARAIDRLTQYKEEMQRRIDEVNAPVQGEAFIETQLALERALDKLAQAVKWAVENHNPVDHPG